MFFLACAYALFQLLKGVCNWFFFFTFMLKIVSRQEKVEKNQKNQQIVEKTEI
jgi:hypothetical protein